MPIDPERSVLQYVSTGSGPNRRTQARMGGFIR